MNPTYAVYTHIDRPVPDVFAAIVDHKIFGQVFGQTSSGDLVEGENITWGEDSNACQVHVAQVIANERIELTFRPADFAIPELSQGDQRDYEAKIVFLVEPADVGGTLVTLCEYGWGTDRRSVLQSYGHCSGWQDMLMCLKALLVHGIDLTSPPNVRPNYAKLWTA